MVWSSGRGLLPTSRRAPSCAPRVRWCRIGFLSVVQRELAPSLPRTPICRDACARRRCASAGRRARAAGHRHAHPFEAGLHARHGDSTDHRDGVVFRQRGASSMSRLVGRQLRHSPTTQIVEQAATTQPSHAQPGRWSPTPASTVILSPADPVVRRAWSASISLTSGRRDLGRPRRSAPASCRRWPSRVRDDDRMPIASTPSCSGGTAHRRSARWRTAE